MNLATSVRLHPTNPIAVKAMEYQPEFAEVLRKLVSGELDPKDWIDWWNKNSQRVGTLLQRGSWLRLKPPKPGRFGPPSRCALLSQSEACKLLAHWGVEFTLSNRYEEAWKESLADLTAERESDRQNRQQRYGTIIELLEPEFPRFARFLLQNLELIESMSIGAEIAEISNSEASLNRTLPAAYKRFLKCCKQVELGDTLKLGLPFTFVQDIPAEFNLSTNYLIGFADCWLEADGDQLFFGEAGEDPPVLYYAHEVPELRPLAGNFTEWVEGIPKWDSWKA